MQRSSLDFRSLSAHWAKLHSGLLLSTDVVKDIHLIDISVLYLREEHYVLAHALRGDLNLI